MSNNATPENITSLDLAREAGDELAHADYAAGKNPNFLWLAGQMYRQTPSGFYQPAEPTPLRQAYADTAQELEWIPE